MRIKDGMSKFMKAYGTYNQNVAKLEHKILFGDDDDLANLENVNDYTKLPFYLEKGTIDFGVSNYKRFIPRSPEIELKPKSKFLSILADVDVKIDTTNVYPNTWSKEFLDFLDNVHSKESRLLHLEIGESFTVAITEDKGIYTWGLNDFNQCGKNDQSFSLGQTHVKNLSVNGAKLLVAGKDHGLMVDNSNYVYVWGKNTEGQLGLDHTRQSRNIYILNTIKGPVKSVASKNNKNLLLTEDGRIYEWPIYKDHQNFLKPCLMRTPNNVQIANIEMGGDFAIFLSKNGILYGQGENEYGQLGTGDFEDRANITVISYLKNKNEKVLEVSCGYKHVICRTSLSKIYTWGFGSNYRLGLGDT